MYHVIKIFDILLSSLPAYGIFVCLEYHKNITFCCFENNFFEFFEENFLNSSHNFQGYSISQFYTKHLIS